MLNKNNINEKIADKVLSSKKIPRGRVRPIDGNILRMFFLGSTVKEIAEATSQEESVIRNRLYNPLIQKELRRLDKLANNEVLRLEVASLREIKEAALKAVRLLVAKLEEGSSNEQIKAAIKVLEYTLGKPKQQLDVKANIGGELSEAARDELRQGLSVPDVQCEERG